MSQAPYEMQWRIDDSGVPYSFAIEETVVVIEPYLCVTLEEIPDSYQRVSITDVTPNSDTVMLGEAMTKSEVKGTKYFVDYNNGVVYFSEAMANKVLQINYYGRGFKRVSAKRIVDLEEVIEKSTGMLMANTRRDNNTILALQHKVEHLEKQIDFLIKEIEKLS